MIISYFFIRAIGGYYIRVVILLAAISGYSIGGYFIGGYWWLFYWWLLVTSLLMDIDGYLIGGYW